MHYLFVPSQMLIDPDTHVHLPWFAAHPTHGCMLCHPVNVAREIADSDLFLSNFNRVPQQTDLNQTQKGHAAFVKMFLVFQQATSPIAYCYENVSYSVNFGQYVPPPFTVTVNEPLGTLFARESAEHLSDVLLADDKQVVPLRKLSSTPRTS
jgi:hypothetical protein